jgi:hypothetical protein
VATVGAGVRSLGPESGTIGALGCLFFLFLLFFLWLLFFVVQFLYSVLKQVIPLFLESDVVPGVAVVD